MTRKLDKIDLDILEALKNLNDGKGATTQEIAAYLKAKHAVETMASSTWPKPDPEEWIRKHT